jgi:hypothetical protein
MGLNPAQQGFVAQFLDAIAPMERGFQDVGLSYVALRSGEHFEIKQGRVYMRTGPWNASLPHFESPNVRAGRYSLPELNLDIRGLIERLIVGVINTSDGPLYFPLQLGGNHAATFVSHHPDGLQTQVRFNVLTIFGGEIAPVPQPEIDWELKAASTPFDGLQELSNEFGVGMIVDRPRFVEFVAHNVAAVDGANSRLSGAGADVHLLLAKGLLPDRITLGYRAFFAAAPARRGSVAGQTIRWTEDAGHLRGQATIPIADSSAIDCIVSYEGIAQAHFWLVNPSGFRTRDEPFMRHSIPS